MNRFDDLICDCSNPTKSMWEFVAYRNGYSRSSIATDKSPDDFNRYFTSIAEELYKQLPACDIDPVDNITIHNSTDIFSFGEVTFNEVRDAINSLKSSNSQDIYNMSARLVKVIKNQVVIPFTKLVNQSIKACIFPSCFKIAKVVPVFKKGVVGDISNYRPISLLPAFSKVYEKI